MTPKSQPDAVAAAAADLQVGNGSGLKVEESDWILVDEGLKEKTGVDWCSETLPFAESGNDEVGSVDTEDNVEVEEESAQYYEVRGKSPGVPVYSSASSEKEVKIASWPEEESPSKDGDVDFKSVQAKTKTETMRDEGLGEMVLENLASKSSDTVEQFAPIVPRNEGLGEEMVLVEEVNTFNVEDGAKETDLDKFANEKYNSIEKSTVVNEESIFGIAENCKELVKVNTTGNEGEVKDLPHVDEVLKETQFDKLAEKYTVTEHPPTPVTEEVKKHSEAKAENLDNILVGVVDTPSCEKEVKVLDPQKEAGELSEIATRSEVARGPLVVCRATLWNCCGLLDVLTCSQR